MILIHRCLTHLHLPTYQLYLYINVLTYRVSPSNNIWAVINSLGSTLYCVYPNEIICKFYQISISCIATYSYCDQIYYCLYMFMILLYKN